MLQSTSECNNNQDLCWVSAKAGDACGREGVGVSVAWPHSLSFKLICVPSPFVNFLCRVCHEYLTFVTFRCKDCRVSINLQESAEPTCEDVGENY